MARVALVVSIIAACFSLVALAITGHRAGVPWGEVSGWVGGVGSFFAAGVALWIGLDNNRKYRRDQLSKTRDARERAARRAKRVHLTAQPKVGGDLFEEQKRVGYTAALDNSSGNPIYDVKWYPPVVVVPADGPSAGQAYCATGATIHGTTTPVLTAAPRVLEPNDTSRMSAELVPVRERHTGRSLQVAVYPVVSFEDDDGNRFGLILDPTLDTNTQTYSGHWEFVDDNYPYECTGKLRELFDQIAQAGGWSPQPDRAAPD